MNEFITESPNIYMEIIDNFQSAKTEFYQDIDAETHSVELPFEFVQFLHAKCKQHYKQDLYQKVEKFSNGKSLKQMFAKNENMFMDNNKKNDIDINMRLNEEWLEMDVEIWKFMFDGVINKIINHVNDLFNDNNKYSLREECKWMYLVGGFSCSKYFQYRMKKEFEDDGSEHKSEGGGLQVIIPKCPTLTIVTGAALFGITKNYITARKSKYFYGIRVIRNMKQAKQYKMSDLNINKNKNENGDRKIKNCFHVMIKKNQLIRMNDTIEISVKCHEKISV